jgi:hypothetical protein
MLDRKAEGLAKGTLTDLLNTLGAAGVRLATMLRTQKVYFEKSGRNSSQNSGIQTGRRA